MYCSNCGLQKIENANYCYGCGIKFIPIPDEPRIMITADDLEKLVLAAKGLYKKPEPEPEPTLKLTTDDLEKIVKAAKGTYNKPESKTYSPSESLSKNDKILSQGKVVFLPGSPPRAVKIYKHVFNDSYKISSTYYDEFVNNYVTDVWGGKYKLGENIFLSRLEAEHIYKERADERKASARTYEENKRYMDEYERKRLLEMRAKVVSPLETKKTCNACGLPIGVWGHCGCSY